MRYDDTFAYVKEIYQSFKNELEISENADKTENSIKFTRMQNKVKDTFLKLNKKRELYFVKRQF